MAPHVLPMGAVQVCTLKFQSRKRLINYILFILSHEIAYDDIWFVFILFFLFNFRLCFDLEITRVFEDPDPKHSKPIDIQGHSYDIICPFVKQSNIGLYHLPCPAIEPYQVIYLVGINKKAGAKLCALGQVISTVVSTKFG